LSDVDSDAISLCFFWSYKHVVRGRYSLGSSRLTCCKRGTKYFPICISGKCKNSASSGCHGMVLCKKRRYALELVDLSEIMIVMFSVNDCVSDRSAKVQNEKVVVSHSPTKICVSLPITTNQRPQNQVP
jgi:hypothetical protein